MKDTGRIEAICDLVKRQIMEKKLFPGNRIVEEDLARAFGISRTRLRAALIQLQYEGFVTVIPNKGTFVEKPTREDIEQVYDVRMHLEMASIVSGIHNFTSEAIERMERNYADQIKLKETFSISEYAQLNREFHSEIAKASGNPYIEKYLSELHNKVHIFLLFFDTSTDNTGSLETHGMLLNAIKRNDLDMALTAIQQDAGLGTRDILHIPPVLRKKLL